MDHSRFDHPMNSLICIFYYALAISHPVKTDSEDQVDNDVVVSVSEGLQQRFTMFNGGFSKDQLDWLDSVLTSADEKRERVTIVSK